MDLAAFAFGMILGASNGPRVRSIHRSTHLHIHLHDHRSSSQPEEKRLQREAPPAPREVCRETFSHNIPAPTPRLPRPKQEPISELDYDWYEAMVEDFKRSEKDKPY